MPKRPIESYRKISSHQHKYLHTVPYNHLQHGSLLLLLPQESLTHVTSYLPPPALLALGRTCKHLCEHIDDDNTWLRALLNQYLGISPEHEFGGERILLLQRTENTWRKEFIFRYELRRRWESSRSPTVTHSPRDSSIDAVHLVSEYGLLTSSIQYGIVARSIPLNGKVLKGYIDASGTSLGIGNPNIEFTPNVSACAMSSDGGTARVFWGKRNGEVALTVANRVMESRAAAKFTRCGVNEQHEGAVHQLVPDSDTNTFLSAGADGRIKLWDTKTLQPLWSTDKQQLSLVADPFISIAGSFSDGFVAGALKSGDILLYDLHESETLIDGPRVRSIHQLRILPPIHNEKPPQATRDALSQQQIAKLWLYRTGEVSAMLLVQYTHHPELYRIHTNVQSHDVIITSYGDRSFSSISTLEPIISTRSRDNNMLVVGDQLGFVSIYDANAPLQIQECVAPIHRFEAHTDGSVTAISWSPAVFATGSARGTTVVWDSLTLEPLRYFTTPAPRPPPGHDSDAVSRILLDKELAVIIIGNRVMTWKIGQGISRGYQHKRAKHANNKMNVSSKGHQQYEMYKDIAESYRELEYERVHSQRIYGREREQRTTLDTLGLSELEAIEYVLMLSREEEEARQQGAVVEEGVFEGDFDNLPSTPISSPSRSSPSTPSSRNHRGNGRQYPHVALATSNEKVQVSPPFVPEPMEAGTSISPLRSLVIGPSALPSPKTARSTSSSSLDQFPAISSSLSSTSSSKRGTSASPEQPRSAWSTPLKSVSPSSPRSRVVTPTHSSSMTLSPVDVARRGEVSRAGASDAEEMDDDLRLAIELSLAEARSRGEHV